MSSRRSNSIRPTKQAVASEFGHPTYLGPPPLGVLRLDASLRTAGEIVASTLHVELIVAAPQREVMKTAALNHDPFDMSAEAKRKTLSAEIVSAFGPNEGALAWVD